MTQRVLVEAGSLHDGATVDLEAAESHHLRVRRIDAGTEVLVLDGAGSSAHGTLVRTGDQIGVEIGVVQVAPALPTTVLAVGAGDKDRFLLLAERCTELGVTRLIPLETERSRTVNTRVRGGVVERARRRTREACKQSGNPWATTVEESCPLAELPIRHPTVRWLLGHVGGEACPTVTPGEAVGWIVGPEGGLAAEELRFVFEMLRAVAVGLAAAVLRFDTAAVAAAVITQDRRCTT